jgi:putative hemolysin
MELITPGIVSKTAKLEKFGGENTARVLMSLLKLDKINQIYGRHYFKDTPEFIKDVLNEAGIRYSLNNEDLAKIPRNGSFIIVANHPYGGVEGLILLNSILKVRPDFKIMANFLFNWIDPLKDCFFGVNPFETHKDSFSSFTGLKKAFAHIHTGHPLAIFPAGEVSTYHHHSKNITDKAWSPSVVKFIKNAEVPVIPVYFHGNNSWLFHFMGRLHPLLRTAKIPSELLNKQNETIRVRIGNPITVGTQNEFQDTREYGRYLRAKTYALSASFDGDDSRLPGEINNGELIAMAVGKTTLVKEIQKITPQYLFFQWQNYVVYSAPSTAIPNIAKEIGRLREITFREVGEGTRRSIDVDEFDDHYEQLFIWDADCQRIAGGYRIGKGKDIIEKFGLKGFYANTLFKIDKEMIPVLTESIELGRSFIVKDYQRKPMPLFLLWKGILSFLMKNQEYKYLVGPVSISNSYTRLSQQLIIDYLVRFHFDHNLGQHIRPRKPFLSQPAAIDTEILLKKIKSFNALDQLIKDTEMANSKMPVLLRKYIELGGKILSFNVDPEFSNSVDGFLLLELRHVKPEIIRMLTKNAGTS